MSHRTETLREEIASALTHGVGAAAALAGGAVLITLAALYGDGWQLSAAIVFGATLLLLYLFRDALLQERMAGNAAGRCVGRRGR